MQTFPQPIVTLRQNAAEHLPSYRCRTRPYNQVCAMDPALDSFIQLKAKNAVEAFRSARLVVDDQTVVVEVERLDA